MNKFALLCGLLVAFIFQDTDGYPLRNWVDSSGKYNLQAKFLRVENDQVFLEQTDGTEIGVEIEKLSSVDQRYIKRLTDNKEKQPKPEPRPKTNKPAKPKRLPNINLNDTDGTDHRADPELEKLTSNPRKSSSRDVPRLLSHSAGYFRARGAKLYLHHYPVYNHSQNLSDPDKKHIVEMLERLFAMSKSDPDARARAEAIEVLGYMSEKVYATLDKKMTSEYEKTVIDSLSSESLIVRAKACRALSRLVGSEIIPKEKLFEVKPQLIECLRLAANYNHDELANQVSEVVSEFEEPQRDLLAEMQRLLDGTNKGGKGRKNRDDDDDEDDEDEDDDQPLAGFRPYLLLEQHDRRANPNYLMDQYRKHHKNRNFLAAFVSLDWESLEPLSKEEIQALLALLPDSAFGAQICDYFGRAKIDWAVYRDFIESRKDDFLRVKGRAFITTACILERTGVAPISDRISPLIDTFKNPASSLVGPEISDFYPLNTSYTMVHHQDFPLHPDDCATIFSNHFDAALKSDKSVYRRNVMYFGSRMGNENVRANLRQIAALLQKIRTDDHLEHVPDLRFLLLALSPAEFSDFSTDFLDWPKYVHTQHRCFMQDSLPWEVWYEYYVDALIASVEDPALKDFSKSNLLHAINNQTEFRPAELEKIREAQTVLEKLSVGTKDENNVARKILDRIK